MIKRFAPRCRGLAANYQKLRKKKKTSGMDLSELKLKRSPTAGNIPEKGHNDIFRFSLFPTTITEWNKLPKEAVTSRQSPCTIKSRLL